MREIKFHARCCCRVVAVAACYRFRSRGATPQTAGDAGAAASVQLGRFLCRLRAGIPGATPPVRSRTPTAPNSTPYSIHSNSGFVGAHVGYNWQTVIVYGLEGDINYFNLNNNQIIPDPPVVYSVAAKETYNGDIRGRIGWAFDRLLAYAAVGLAFGTVQTAYTQFGRIPAPYLTTTTERAGWTAGGGLEYALTDHWLTRIEYRHTDLGRRSFVNADPAIDTADSVKFTTDLVLAALSYKF